MSLSPSRSVRGPEDYQTFIGGHRPAHNLGESDDRLVRSANSSGRYHIDRERTGDGVKLGQWGMQVKPLSKLDSCPAGDEKE